MRRTWLAIVLSIVMAVTFIPSTAFAVATDDVDMQQDIVESNDGEDVVIENAGVLTDEDFLEKDEEGNYYKYAMLPVGIEIDGVDWDGEELCNCEIEYSTLCCYPSSAGTSKLIVTGTGEEDDIYYKKIYDVSISQDTVDILKYTEFLTSYYLWDTYYDEEDNYEGTLCLQDWNETLDGEIITDQEFKEKLTIQVIFNGTTYDCALDDRQPSKGAYSFKLPAGLDKQIKWKDSFVLRYTMGAAVVEKTIKRVRHLYVEPNDAPNSLTWTGEPIRPVITYKDPKENYVLEEGKDLFYEYGDNVNVGEGDVYVMSVEDGDYYVDLHHWFEINPKGTTLGKLKRGKKAITVTWKKQTTPMSVQRISGYQIQVATNSKFTKNKKTTTVKGYNYSSKKIKKLKKKKKYYVRIRTYMKTGGNTYYSKWSKASSVKTK